MKNIIKCIIFIFIFGVIWKHVFNILWLDYNALMNFYDEPKNTMDIVYIGDCNVHERFNNVLAYNLYGFTTGILGNGYESAPTIKYLIKEAQKYQSPSLYIIDIGSFIYDNARVLKDEAIINISGSMKLSKNRIDLTTALLNYSGKEKDLNYYFGFFAYHHIWKDINVNRFFGTNHYKGFYVTEQINPQEKYIWTNDYDEDIDYDKDIFDDLINYINTNSINVLFIVPNRYYTHDENVRANVIISKLKEYKFPVINFNTLNDLYFNFDTDFYNKLHLNVYGSIKYTLYISQYLMRNYKLPDHRNDPKYNSWDIEYQRFKKDFEIKTEKNLDEFILKNS